ncbi:MAG: hypothetical protein QME61_01550 [Patescibacteria group bacterium]|nr:hypothetical protein [Patescibacteria group bacterium]
MKKLFFLIFLIGLILSFSTFAQIIIENPLRANTIEEVVDNFINFIFYLAIALAPLMIIIGAFYLLIAGGEAKKVETGKKIILYTLIGFAIVLFAKGLISVIKSVLGVK